MAALATASGTRIALLSSLDLARTFPDRYGPSGPQLDDDGSAEALAALGQNRRGLDERRDLR